MVKHGETIVPDFHAGFRFQLHVRRFDSDVGGVQLWFGTIAVSTFEIKAAHPYVNLRYVKSKFCSIVVFTFVHDRYDLHH